MESIFLKITYPCLRDVRLKKLGCSLPIFQLKCLESGIQLKPEERRILVNWDRCRNIKENKHFSHSFAAFPRPMVAWGWVAWAWYLVKWWLWHMKRKKHHLGYSGWLPFEPEKSCPVLGAPWERGWSQLHGGGKEHSMEAQFRAEFYLHLLPALWPCASYSTSLCRLVKGRKLCTSLPGR